MKHFLLALATSLFVVVTSRPFDGTRWNNPPPSLPAHVTHQTFHSASMNVDVGFNVYLPPDYDSGDRRYPVIYFLHGRDSDENTELAQFDAYSRSNPPPEAIVVFPNGGRNSKYIDAVAGSPMWGRLMAETMIIHELIPHIDGHYRTKAEPEGRAIQGFSMGGMGALRLAFKHPRMFSSVFAFAPALDDTAENLADQEGDLLRYMLGGDVAIWRAEMAATLLSQHTAEIRDVGLRVDLIVGAEDDLQPWVSSLAAELGRLKIPHTFEVVARRSHAYSFGPNLAAALANRTSQPK